MRHISRTHSVHVGRLYDRSKEDPPIQIKYVNTTQQLAADRWTPLTLLVNIMAHTTFTQSAGESFATYPVHSLHSNDCQDTINDKKADMDYHAIPPPDFKRDELCQQDPHTFTLPTTGTSSSSRQLEATGASSKSGQPGAMRDPLNTGNGKVHCQANTDGENNLRMFDDIAAKFSPFSEEELEFYNLVLNSRCAKFWKSLNNLQDFSLNVACCSQYSSDCSWASLYVGEVKAFRASSLSSAAEQRRFAMTIV